MFPLAVVSRYFLTALLGATLLAGCGGADKPKEMEVPAPISIAAEPNVSGELADYLTVVPGSYQVTIAPNSIGSTGGYKLTAKVKVRFTKPKSLVAKDDNSCCGPQLSARLLDASGAPIDGFDGLTDNTSRTALAGMMKRGQGEEWITFHTQDSFFGDDGPAQAKAWLSAVQQAKKIGLVSSVSVADASAEGNAAGDATDANAVMAEAKAAIAAASGEATADIKSASGGDCDAFLAGYEEYVNDYVALAKEMQANPSDAALLARSSALSMKATQWASKAKGCENDPDFQAKYTALSTKMAMGMGQ